MRNTLVPSRARSESSWHAAINGAAFERVPSEFQTKAQYHNTTTEKRMITEERTFMSTSLQHEETKPIYARPRNLVPPFCAYFPYHAA